MVVRTHRYASLNLVVSLVTPIGPCASRHLFLLELHARTAASRWAANVTPTLAAPLARSPH